MVELSDGLTIAGNSAVLHPQADLGSAYIGAADIPPVQ